ncbi:DUF1573 domain-containing protein [Fulvivirga sp. M361]|uniref:DUF1573 domain-containing protein n=1 Tax=Fulvivirga sp. M361 TaxID=2594266 RepID=UPI00117A982B|nr:DUF1573 domain-containing protein [Fulvivirga sp. M361]TRX48402.1 DUF1573 domain-containing protein [Fulvivirga sp. M361]
MKYTRCTSFVVLLMLMTLNLNVHVFAQQMEELKFSETTFDFGEVKESNGPVTHEFTFINNSKEPVTITGVRASCGCTTPAWTKEPVLPGNSGSIQAQYNPKNRPGAFNKSLTVTFNGTAESLRLFIKGKVSPKPRSIEEDMPAIMGALRMKYRSFNLGRVTTTKEPTVKDFEVYNSGDENIEFLDSIIGPNHINFEFVPKVLAPKESGLIKVTYHASSLNELGFRNDNVAFYTNEAGENAMKSISVYATLQEYFPPMTEAELLKAPKLKIEEAMHDFGRLKPGKVVSTEFILTNEGKKPLEIRTHKSNCDCTTAKFSKTTLKEGEKATVKVTFNAKGRRGNQQKSVTIFSNDPRSSAQRVTIKAYVESQTP